MLPTHTPRWVALAAVAASALACVAVLARGGNHYTVNAEFADAGQLVKGDLVTLGGHTVGSVAKITLTRHGLADVRLSITARSATPLTTGAVASIGQLSLTGVANRFVALTPGPGAAIPSGGTLPPTQTHGIVDLDEVLDSLTPPVRTALQGIFASGAYLLSGKTVGGVNRFSAYLNPAFIQARAFASALVSDRASLGQFVRSSGALSEQVSANDRNLAGVISGTAAALDQAAGARTELQDVLRRAPRVLTQGRRVLVRADAGLAALNPTLRALRPAAPRLATLLRRLVPFGRDLAPTITAVHAILPGAISALHRVRPVLATARPALASLTTAVHGLTPILTGIRPYAPDVTAGFFNGIGGSAGAGYDANGHYLDGRILLQGGGDSLTGLLSLLGDATLKLPGLSGARGELTQTCPGGGGIPSLDKTAPWASPAGEAAGLCAAEDDQR